MKKCKDCGKNIYGEKIFSYCEETPLCWFCMKKRQLKDERDWEDDERNEEEE